MSKVSAVFIISLLFCFSITYAARPAPALGVATSAPIKTHPEGVEVEEKCGAGDEECLMRRTLAAHLDYIYTQNHNP